MLEIARGITYQLSEVALLLGFKLEEARAWVRVLEMFESVIRDERGARCITSTQLEQIVAARVIASTRLEPCVQLLRRAAISSCKNCLDQHVCCLQTRGFSR
jgi:hypothetical protein